MKILNFLSMLAAAGMLLGSCTKEPGVGEQDASVLQTRTVIGEVSFFDPELGNQIPLDSTKFVKAASISSTDNPLNAGAYMLSDGSAFFDIVCLEFGWLWEKSDCLPDLEIESGTHIRDYEGYIKPLQDKGIRVLLTIKSGYGRWGFGNLDNALVEDLSDQIRDFVIKYKLNGVNLVDLEADYDDPFQQRPLDASYSNLILALRKKLSDRRVITVRDAEYSSTLTPEAVAAINYMWPFSYGKNYFAPPKAPVIPNRKWSPQRIPTDTKLAAAWNTVIKRFTQRALDEGMGAVAFYRLGKIDMSGTFTAVEQTIRGDSTIVVTREAVYE